MEKLRMQVSPHPNSASYLGAEQMSFLLLKGEWGGEGKWRKENGLSLHWVNLWKISLFEIMSPCP